MTTNTLVVEATHLTRLHRDGGRELRSLDDASVSVEPGEVVAVMGPSGSGKTTLMHLLGGLDEPDAGEVRIAGVDWRTLHGEARAEFRRKNCGFVVQGFALLPQATAAENVEVPLVIDGVPASQRGSRVAEALNHVDMTNEGTKVPDQLSGGQQQRVAIARAIVNRPAVILADEPTGNLDSASAATVVDVLLRCAADWESSVVLVTHDPVVAGRANRIVTLHSGRVVGS
jgi:putative ABC transport system ATP-binding protein